MTDNTFKEKQEIISIYKVEKDESIHARAETNDEMVNDLTNVINSGRELPPIIVFKDGDQYWLADGFYRYEAYLLVYRDTLPAIIHEGGRKEALLYALGANQNHGLRRSNKDKRKAVTIAFTDPDIRRMSDNQIAKICKVTQPFVSKIRRILTQNGYKLDGTRVCSNGKVMDVSNIGARQETVSVPVGPEAPAVADNNDEVVGSSEDESLENLIDQESNPETNVDTAPGDNDLGTGTQGDANIPPEPVDDISETGGSEDDDGANLDTQDNDPDSDDVTDPETTKVDVPEEPETDNQDVSQNESGDQANGQNSEDSTELGAGENDPDDSVDTDDEGNDSSEQVDQTHESGEEDLVSDHTTESNADENAPTNDGDDVQGEVGESDDNESATSDIEDVEDVDNMKRIISQLKIDTEKQEKELQFKDNYINKLEQEIEKLKNENEYLKIQIQSSANIKTDASASLDIEKMDEIALMDEEEVFAMA